MMNDRMTIWPRLLLSLLMGVFMTMSVQAQDEDDDDDIAYSLDLSEVTVLSNGMSFEEYLVKQVLEHAKPLKSKVSRLHYSVTCQLEKDMDLKKFPHRRTITLAARLAGYGPIVTALRDHKLFGITMAEDVVFDRGKITTSNVRMVEMKQQLTEKQVNSFLKHDGFLSVNIYDKFYNKVRERAKKIQKLHRKQEDTGMEYVGSYKADNRTVYIVKLGNMRVHIAEGCWQITRLSYDEGQNHMNYVCKEVRPNLYLLSHGTAKMYLDRAKWPKGYVALKVDYTYR